MHFPPPGELFSGLRLVPPVQTDDLCPSHPDVRAYADALARSVARQGVDTVVAESLHFGYFRHGYHHDRSFVDLGPREAPCSGCASARTAWPAPRRRGQTPRQRAPRPRGP